MLLRRKSSLAVSSKEGKSLMESNKSIKEVPVVTIKSLVVDGDRPRKWWLGRVMEEDPLLGALYLLDIILAVVLLVLLVVFFTGAGYIGLHPSCDHSVRERAPVFTNLKLICKNNCTNKTNHAFSNPRPEQNQTGFQLLLSMRALKLDEEVAKDPSRAPKFDTKLDVYGINGILMRVWFVRDYNESLYTGTDRERIPSNLQQYAKNLSVHGWSGILVTCNTAALRGGKGYTIPMRKDGRLKEQGDVTGDTFEILPTQPYGSMDGVVIDVNVTVKNWGSKDAKVQLHYSCNSTNELIVNACEEEKLEEDRKMVISRCGEVFKRKGALDRVKATQNAAKITRLEFLDAP